MRIRELVISGLCLTLWSGGTATAEPLEGTELRCGFAKRDKIVLTLNDKHTTTMEAPQIGEIRVTFDFVLEAAATVQSVTDAGLAKLKCKIARWRVALDNGQDGSGFELDTRPLRGQPNRKIAGLNGKTFMVEVTTRGEVKKVSGLTKLLRVMGAAARDPKSATKLLQTECSDDAVRAKLQECWGQWPEESVEASASWSQECKTTLSITGNAMTASASATLNNVNDTSAEVRLTGSIAGTGGRATLWDDDEEPKKGTGVGRRGGFDMGAMIRRVLRNTHVEFDSGSFEGERRLNRETGLVEKAHTLWVSQVTMNIEMPDLGGFGGGGGGGGGEERALPAKIEQRRELRCERPGKKR